MSSAKQLKANKLNAQKSTGPKTVDGKSVVSKNSLKHGLLSKETILSWENQDEYNALATKFLTTLNPENEIESVLVDRIVSIVWRLKRAGRIETGIFTQKRYNLNAHIEKSNFSRSEAEAFDKIIHHNTSAMIRHHPDLLDLGIIFCEHTEGLINLQRYETNLEKSFFKAIHELDRIQAKRKGEPTSLPLAIDINSDFDK